jgi:hypothetical protein
MTQRYLCIDNKDYASLEIRRVYSSVSDPEAEKRGQLRIRQDGGRTSLYPRALFTPYLSPA